MQLTFLSIDKDLEDPISVDRCSPLASDSITMYGIVGYSDLAGLRSFSRLQQQVHSTLTVDRNHLTLLMSTVLVADHP
jgi:hypothetical protein